MLVTQASSRIRATAEAVMVMVMTMMMMMMMLFDSLERGGSDNVI